MISKSCLCLLRFKSFPLSDDVNQEGINEVLVVEVETDSAVPPSTTQGIWQVQRFDFERLTGLSGKVILVDEAYKDVISEVVFFCAERKAAAVLISKHSQQQPLPTVTTAVPLFMLEQEIFNQVVENQWMVSFEVLQPLPDHLASHSEDSSVVIVGESQLQLESTISESVLDTLLETLATIPSTCDNSAVAPDTNIENSVANVVRQENESNEVGLPTDSVVGQPNEVSAIKSFIAVLSEKKILTEEKKIMALKVLGGLCTSIVIYLLVTSFLGWFRTKRGHCTGKVAGDDAEVPGTLFQQSRNWTLDELYPDVRCENDTACLRLYPSRADEAHMRRWLNDHKLPQDVGDKLLYYGVRDTDDIVLLLQSKFDDGIFSELAVFDILKLQQAVRQHASCEANKGSTCREATTIAVTQRGMMSFTLNNSTEVEHMLQSVTMVPGMLLHLLRLGFAVTTVRSATLMHRFLAREGASMTLYSALIVLASLIRSIWFAAPNLVVLPSALLTTAHHLDLNDGIADGSFLSLLMAATGSLAVFFIFNFLMVGYLCPLDEYWRRQGPSSFIVISIMIALLAAAEIWLVRLNSQSVLSMYGVLFFESAAFAAFSIMAACWVNVVLVRLLVACATFGASIAEKEAHTIPYVTGLCNFFFFTRGVLETICAMILFVDGNAHQCVTEWSPGVWLDIFYISKFLCELVMLVLGIELLLSSNRFN